MRTLGQYLERATLSFESCSVTQSCDPTDCSTPGLRVHHQLPEFTKTHVHWVGDAIQPSHPLLPLLLLPPIPPSIRVFSDESALCIRYWSFGFSISPSKEYSRLISSRIDWFELLTAQGLSRVFSSTTAQKHQFFMVQLSHPYTTTGKTIALTVWNFVGKVMSLLFNTLSRLVIAFLPRSRHLLILCYIHSPQWFWSPSK